jgi:protein-L-isoaspartate(D-aspartate) O-methyltransferase
MVQEQIEARGVHHPAVLHALRETPRHLFVPRKLEGEAYTDRALPIGFGQTISQPYIVGLMSELLEPDRSAKVLEIGTGSGYQAAVLSQLFGRVYSIEVVTELARSAAELLDELDYHNVTVRNGDGYQGWPEEAPFDRIILTAAPPELPRALVDQLKPGGLLVAPVGRGDQELILVRKTLTGRVETRSVIPVVFVPMVPGRQLVYR